MTREMLDPALICVAMSGLCAALINAWSVRRPFRLEATRPGEGAQLFGTLAAAALVALAATGDVAGTLLGVCLIGFAACLLKLCLPALTIGGAVEMGQGPLAFVVGAPWTYLLLHEHQAPGWTMALMLAGTAVSAALLGVNFAEKLVRRAMMTHESWRRPYRPLTRRLSGRTPKVSIHLPCYAEPPEIVMEVLDHLYRLDYPNFEVLVCDNNTEDEALWRPLAAHCARLDRPGRHFKFHHVAPLAGAKAGALNYLLDHMAPDAELVAVIDADYISEPDFLSRLVGFFDDPKVGYVQTPHDYRQAEGSDYMRACYWEYMPTNKVEMPGINEYGSAFTIGTMCVIRKDALEAAGRWAEWCLTEDSEVSVRLRALGARGVYLRDTFGRGLIPETFEDYKKQRFRWTAGPVQQLRRHWRLYLPGGYAAPSAMENWSKLLEVQRGIAPLLQLGGLVGGMAMAVLGVVLTLQGQLPQFDLPGASWLALLIGGATLLVGRWHRYRLSGCENVGDMVRGELARISLTYVQMVAAIAGLSKRPLAWRRTPKFEAAGSGMRALSATIPETCLGLAHLALVLVPLRFADELGPDVTLLLVAAGILSSIRFFAAPAMALLGERRLAARANPAPRAEGVLVAGRTAEA